MKKLGVVILGLIIFAVILVMVLVEIIELAIGAVLLLVGVAIVWWLWNKIKDKFD